MKRAIACMVVAVIGLQAGRAAAECCRDCGCSCECCKVCRCVPDIKKVPKITYCCKSEDFCIPGPSKICGYKCVCPDEPKCDDDCECKHHYTWFTHKHAHKEPIYQPTCAKVHTRHVLVKKEVIKEVPGWKFEVVDLCPKCKACNKYADVGQMDAAQIAAAQAAATQTAAAQTSAVPPQAPSEKAMVDYYGQSEEEQPAAQLAASSIAQPAAATEEPKPQKAELVSHSAPSLLKRMLMPKLAK